MWKKIEESQDLICYEKRSKSFMIRIEARLEKNKWKIFKRYINEEGLDHIENFESDTRADADRLIKSIMSKNLTKKDIIKATIEKSRDINLEIRRIFREYAIEKWEFSVRPDKEKNIIFIRTEDSIEIDIIINSRYRSCEGRIISELMKILSVNEDDAIETTINIFYYEDRTQKKKKQPKNKLIMGKIEIGYDIVYPPDDQKEP
ncbi:hypothetical protein JXB31_04385 [Candidatus Woesearchaeota archaeon]|nr:hypothetical protein [Candidatus Woesearchaeota archaeon]